jgi:hypothetical protein
MNRPLTLLLFLVLLLASVGVISGEFPPLLSGQVASSATERPTGDAQLSHPVQPLIYLEGTIVLDPEECGCRFLRTVDFGTYEIYELWGDLEGFTCGDRVGVWGSLCPDCVSICMYGAIFIVEDIVELAGPDPVDPVGGIAQIPDVSDSSPPNYIALASLAAAALLALTTAAWYATRHLS